MKQTLCFACNTQVANVQYVHTRVVHKTNILRTVICNVYTTYTDSNTELARCVWLQLDFSGFVTSHTPQLDCEVIISSKSYETFTLGYYIKCHTPPQTPHTNIQSASTESR